MKKTLLAPACLRSGLLVTTLMLLAALSSCKKQEQAAANGAAPSSGAPSPGYTLVQTLTSMETDLIDLEGRVVHRWTSSYMLGGGAYIQPNGNLLRTCILPQNPFNQSCPGLSGAAEILDWEGNRLWFYEFATAERTLHHDITMLPNGNILMIGVEQKNREEQIAAGRDPSRMRHDEMWFDYIIELKPTGRFGGEVVWEWHMWDHLIQDVDKTKRNYGVVADHPEKIDINFIEENIQARGSATMARLQSLGYVGGGSGGGPGGSRPSLPDWTHANSVAYNAKLDQIVLSVRGPGELWVLDHSTTAEEAATDKGGRHGKGGGLLYRWGNPQAYQRGTPQDQQLFGQHDVHWIDDGLPGAGNILIFNNGDNRLDGAYSSIEEIRPPVKADGSYEMEEGSAYGPEKPAWRYVAEPKESFYSQFLSGVQRLPNGNTLICAGMSAELIEVTPDGKTVWTRKMGGTPGESRAGGRPPGGPMAGGPGGDPGGPGGMMPPRPMLIDPAGNHDLSATEIGFLFGPDSLLSAPPPQMPGEPGGPEGPGGPPGGPDMPMTDPFGGPGGPGGGPGGPGGMGGPSGPGGGPGGPGGMGGPFGGPGGPDGGPGGPGGMGGPGGPGGGPGGPGGMGGPFGGPGGPDGGPGGHGGMGGPGGPGGGPGGSGGGPGGGGPPSKGIFRATRYIPEHPAFNNRKLNAIASEAVAE